MKSDTENDPCKAFFGADWIRVSRLDAAGRRSLWVRITPVAIDLRGGREGGDSFATLMLDGSTTREELVKAMDTIDYGVWAYDIDGKDV